MWRDSSASCRLTNLMCIHYLSNANTHFALPLLTQWYDNVCARRRTLPLTHTHNFVMENSFMAALKRLLKQHSDCPPPPLPAAAVRSLVTPSLLSARCHASCTHPLHFQHPGFSSFSSAHRLPSPASRCLLTFSSISFPSVLYCRFAVLLTSVRLQHKSVFCKYFTWVKYFFSPPLCVGCLFFFHVLRPRRNSNIFFFSWCFHFFFLIISSLVV